MPSNDAVHTVAAALAAQREAEKFAWDAYPDQVKVASEQRARIAIAAYEQYLANLAPDDVDAAIEALEVAAYRDGQKSYAFASAATKKARSALRAAITAGAREPLVTDEEVIVNRDDLSALLSAVQCDLGFELTQGYDWTEMEKRVEAALAGEVN